jgi:regulator of protease activity HflC (stomatin/prohibitin superfamily)
MPLTTRLLQVINQEVLTKDSIALRFSFAVQYKITDGLLFLSHFNAFDNLGLGLLEADNLIRIQGQLYLREKIGTVESTELGQQREVLTQHAVGELGEKLLPFGVTLLNVAIVDITFPKMIQELFTKDLESRIRAKSELENARTTVATARTLKNAADLIKQNEEVKFVQLLETITKIAEKGKHTFHFGDIVAAQLPKKSQ